jgi:hypothetical protein
VLHFHSLMKLSIFSVAVVCLTTSTWTIIAQAKSSGVEKPMSVTGKGYECVTPQCNDCLSSHCWGGTTEGGQEWNNGYVLNTCYASTKCGFTWGTNYNCGTIAYVLCKRSEYYQDADCFGPSGTFQFSVDEYKGACGL